MSIDEIKAADLVPGDMPGDKILIDESHLLRARKLFPILHDFLKESSESKICVSIFGGSGSGKSEIGSILSYRCRKEGYPTYLLSGDNYPVRCSPMNDAERLNRFRNAGLSAMIKHEDFCDDWNDEIQSLIRSGEDALLEDSQQISGKSIYQTEGCEELKRYLGTHEEIDFTTVNWIINEFKSGAAEIPLKRIGLTPEETKFELVDFSSIQVLIVEWTHGMSGFLNGIDFPIFLYSTQNETAEHRKLRGRDSNTDSLFTILLLSLEQELINRQAPLARVIITKDGQFISPGDFEEFLRNEH